MGRPGPPHMLTPTEKRLAALAQVELSFRDGHKAAGDAECADAAGLAWNDVLKTCRFAPRPKERSPALAPGP